MNNFMEALVPFYAHTTLFEVSLVDAPVSVCIIKKWSATPVLLYHSQ